MADMSTTSSSKEVQERRVSFTDLNHPQKQEKRKSEEPNIPHIHIQVHEPAGNEDVAEKLERGFGTVRNPANDDNMQAKRPASQRKQRPNSIAGFKDLEVQAPAALSETSPNMRCSQSRPTFADRDVSAFTGNEDSIDEQKRQKEYRFLQN